MRIIVIALFLIASISAALPLLAPFIGLGTGEDYFFYKAAGVARKYHLVYSLAILMAAVLAEGCRRNLSAIKGEIHRIIISLKDRRNVCLLISAIIAACVMGEVFARVFIYWKHSGPGDLAIFTNTAFVNKTIPAPGHGHYLPNITVNRLIFDASHVLGHESTFKVNNYGLISENNYAIERSPDSKEYRIAILGDSLAASLPSDVTWADILQERMQGDGELRHRLNVDQIKVLNFGQSGAGFRDFIRIYCYVARKFSPNLMVTSFITDDLYRTYSNYNVVEDDSRNSTCDQITADIVAKREVEALSQSYMKLGEAMYKASQAEAELPHQIAVTRDVEQILRYCSKAPFLSITDSCTPINSYVAPRAIALDAKKMLTARQKARETYLLHHILLGSAIWLPVALFEKGNVVVSYHRTNWRFWEKRRGRTKDNEVALRNGADFVAFMSRQQHDTIMLLNPVHSELAQKEIPELAREFITGIEESGKTPVYNLLPDVLALKEQYGNVNRLFNIPYDGHFSNLGSLVYAEAVHKTLREYLLRGKVGKLEGSSKP